MAGPIAQLMIKLGLDATDVESGVAKAKSSTGGLGITSKQVFTGVALGAGVAFGAMTKGALEMERAQGDFQAATGRSAEEARTFGKDMNGLVGNANTVGLSFGKITEAGIAVADQFQLTGEKGTALTNSILGYSKVVRADGVTATQELEDTLSAYGLTADDAVPTMDRLIASHHRFGTEAGPETLSILRGMAPALQAAGAGIDDGIALLNLFETAGMDAGSAQRGLNKAVQELKPGETLDDLIARVTAVEDPTLRAQTAMDIFGTKSGVGLANALKPGIGGLDDFAVSAEEAAGTTEKAVEDMMTTGDKIRGLADKFLAGARDIGSQFGPAIMGLSTVGSLVAPMAGGLNKAVGQVALKVIPAAMLAGTTIGAAQGEGQVAAATGTQVVGALFTRIGAMAIPLAPAGATVGTAVGAAMGLAIPLGIIGAGAAIAAGITVAVMTPIRDSGVVNDLWDTIFGEGADLRDKVANFTRRMDGYLAQGLTFEEARAKVQQEMADLFGTPMAQTITNAYTAGSATGQEIAHGLEDQRETLRFAGQAAMAAVGDGAREAAPGVSTYFNAFGNESAQNVGLGFRQSAAQVADDMRETLRLAGQAAEAEALGDARELGRGIPGEIGRGMMQESRQVLDSAETLKDILENGLTPEEQATKVIGKKYVKLVQAGITSEIPGARETAQQMAIQAIATIEQAGLTGAKGQRGLKQIGVYYDTLLASGLTAAEAKAALAAGGVSQATIDGLGEYAAQAGPVATSYVTKFTKALLAGKPDVKAAIFTVFGKTMAGASPPEEGPLRDAVLSAPAVAGSYVELFGRGLASSAQALRGRLRLLVPELDGWAPAGFRAETAIGAGMISAAGDAGVTIFGGIHIPITVEGNGDPDAIGEAARKGVMEALDEYIAGARDNAHVRFTTEPA